MTTPRVAFLGFVSGASLALGLMGAYAARTAYTITRAHRWADVQRIR